MCFGGGGGNAPAQQAAPEPRWYMKPPDLDEPKLQLNEDATEGSKKKRRTVGTQQLQIPLVPKNSKAGLGITGGRR
jgi:hypothetical protein